MRAITVRLAGDDAERVDAIIRDVPLTNPHAVVRAAARFGLRHLEANPAEVVGLLREQGVRVTGR